MSDAPHKPRRPRKKPVRDLALVGGPTEDGEGTQVLRLRNGALSAGELRPLREGRDVRASELVRLRALEGHERAFEVEVVQEAGTSAEPAEAAEAARTERGGRGAGPVRASNPGYRRNFDRVFGTRGSGNYSIN